VIFRSSKVNNFHVIWKDVCHFRDTVTYILKLSIKNFGQTAAARDMITIDSQYEVAMQRPIRCYYRRPPTTYHLATIPHDWLAYHSALWSLKIIQKFSCHLKANMWLNISDQYKFMPYFAPFSHNTSVTDDNRQTTKTVQNVLKLHTVCNIWCYLLTCDRSWGHYWKLSPEILHEFIDRGQYFHK